MADKAMPYVVLLRKPEQLSVSVLAAVLARARGCPTLDAMAAARSCWGILEEDHAEAAAKRLAAALTAAGCESLALPQNLVEDLPPAAAVVKADLGSPAPAFFAARGEPHPGLDASPQAHALPDGLRYGGPAGLDAALLSAAILKRSVPQTIRVQKDISLTDKALQVGLLLATGLPIRTARMRKEEQRTVLDPELWGVLDIILRAPVRRLRVLSDGFDYSCLKEEKTYDTLSNFRALARRLAALWPEAGRNRGLRFILDGKPQRDMGYESAADLERESRWLLTLQGLRP